jgi:hypothetical protein
MSHGGIQGWAGWLASTYGKSPERYGPKRFSQIFKSGRNGFSPASEWAMADAFRRPWTKGAVSAWKTMTKDDPGCDMFPTAWTATKNEQWGSCSSDIQSPTSSDASGQLAPTAPFHMNGGYQKVPTRDSNGVVTGYVTGFKGKVNTLFFDMHVEGQNGWRGTVNVRVPK